MREVLIRLLKGTDLLKTQAAKKCVVFSYFRCLGTIVGPQNTTDDANSKIISKNARNNLQTILGIKEIESLKLISADKRLLYSTGDLISKNYEICLQNKLSLKLILKNPFLLSEQHLKRKINKLAKLSPIELSSSIPLAKLGMRQLSSFLLDSHKSLKRIHDLCQLFNITVDKVCEELSTKPFLFVRRFDELEGLLNMFYECGFTRADLLKDLWVFSYSNTFIRNRLDFIRNNNIAKRKTWMIRCPEVTLYMHIKRESDDRNILGKNSVAQYLSEKLNCTETVAKSLIRKHPQLQNKSLLKMNIMIDLLYRQGFKPLHICKIPKILLHSIKTTEERLKELAALGKKTDGLYILTKSQKQYLEYIENLEKNKGNEPTAV